MYLLIRKLVRLSALGEVVTSLILKSLDHLIKVIISVGDQGDACYLAPETMDSKFTKACDVFSLGVTLLELATDLDLPQGGPLWHKLRDRGPDPVFTKHITPDLR